MPWIKAFCAAIILIPSLAAAQKKNSVEGMPLAENINNDSPMEVPEAARARVSTGPTQGGSAGVTKVSNQDKAAELHSANKLTERSRKAVGDQYVPLAGEIEYFGKNNDYVLQYTKSYFERNYRHFVTIQTRSERYFKLIDKTFARRNVPLELKYLSVIESALNNKALSKAGALGPWQFMATTGQFMGLVVNGKVDERTDWQKSTNAAAKYLNYLYDMLGDWLLVVAAYNSGPRPVLNAIKKTGKSDFFAIKKYLPAETQNHVMAFVATATIMERMGRYIGAPVPAEFDWKWLNSSTGGAGTNAAVGTKPKNPLLLRFSEEELQNMAIVKMDKPVDLDVLAYTLNEERRKIGRWNFDYYTSLEAYKAGEIKHFLIRIPKDKLELFLEKKSSIERAKVDMSIFDQ